jgi:hypothetical protein
VARLTAPSTPITASAPSASSASAVNPLQVWTTLFENLFSLQRRTWATMASFAGSRDEQNR